MTVRTVNYPSKRFIKKIMLKISMVIFDQKNKALETLAYEIFWMIEKYVIRVGGWDRE